MSHYKSTFFTDKAAIKIQSVFRGHKVRANMKQSDSSTKEADKPENAASSGTNQEPSKEDLEAEFREDDKGAIYHIL